MSRLDAELLIREATGGQQPKEGEVLTFTRRGFAFAPLSIVGGGSSGLEPVSIGVANEGDYLKFFSGAWRDVAGLAVGDLVGVVVRTKLPSQIAYEDEANAFTALNQFKDVELDDQDATPVADRRLRTVDGLVRVTDVGQVEGRHVSRLSLEQVTDEEIAEPGITSKTKLPTDTIYEAQLAAARDEDFRLSRVRSVAERVVLFQNYG